MEYALRSENKYSSSDNALYKLIGPTRMPSYHVTKTNRK